MKTSSSAIFAPLLLAQSVVFLPQAKAQLAGPEPEEWIYENPAVSGRCDADKVPDRTACITAVNNINDAGEIVLLARDAITSFRASLERTLTGLYNHKPTGLAGVLGWIVDEFSGGRDNIINQFKDTSLATIAVQVDRCEKSLHALDQLAEGTEAPALYAASMIRFFQKRYDIRTVCTLRPVKDLNGPR